MNNPPAEHSSNRPDNDGITNKTLGIAGKENTKPAGQKTDAVNTMEYILNSLEEMIYVTRPETDEIIFINDRMRRHYGIDGDVIGQACYKVFQNGMTGRCSFCPCYQLDREPDRAIVWEEHSTLTKRIYRNTDRYTDWPDGTRVHFQHSVDITEIKDAEALKQARGAEERINVMFDAMPMCANYWTVDTATGDYKIAGCNEEIVRLFGLKNKQEYSDRFFELSPEFQPDGRPSGETAKIYITRAYKEGYCRFEWMMQNLKGEPIPVDVSLVRIKRANDYVVAAYFQDLREMKALEQQKMREADERTKVMLNATPLACRLWNKDFRIFDCNNETVRLFGVKNKQEYMERYFELSPEFQPDGKRSHEKTIEILKRVFKEGRLVFEWMHRSMDGAPLPVEITLVRVKYHDDYIIAGYTRDLRESKALTQEIHDEKEKFRTAAHWYESLLDALPFMVTAQDMGKNFTFINSATVELLEKNRQEMIGKPCSNLGLNICNTDNCAIACVKRGQTRTYFTHESASYQADIKILKDLQGETSGYIEVIQDITRMESMARRQAELEAKLEMEKMAKNQAKAEAASTAKSEFLAHMSHEIRTPMNSIIGFADLASGEVMSPKAKDYLQNIMENSKLLLQIINDILDISKIESGNMKLETVPFDLQDLLANCQSIIYPKAVEKGVEMHFHTESPIRKKLYGDPLRLRQVLLNLLSNAVKFTEAGRIDLIVNVISSTEEEATLCFEVNDNGIGMTREQIAVILKPFVQADVSTTREYGGTGLGLSISKSILDLMGSKLDIESTPRVGSKFSFTVTLAIAGDMDEESESGIDAGEIKKPMFAGDILVFEDNKMNQQVIIENLARVGLNTEIAENGLIGIEKVKQRIEKGEKPFDLIFMDIQMPVMDGIEATPKIIALGSGTPVVAMTANVLTADKELYQNLGMTDYLGKPFTSRELWHCLLKHLQPVSFDVPEEEDDTLQNKLKADFVKSNQDIFGEISRAVDSGDITLAHRLAHTIKSNAGLIGMTGLQKAAAEVESALKNGGNSEAPMRIFQYELSKALNELKPFIEEAAVYTQPEISGDIDTEAAAGIFDKLEPLLKSGSLESLKLIDELRGIPGSGELIEKIEDLYFGDAEKVLAKLKENMGIV